VNLPASNLVRLAPCGIPLAWRQISSDRKRLVTALAGVSFGVMLMLFQLGVYKAIMEMVIRPIRALDGELMVISRNFEYLYAAERFPERRIYQVLADREVASVHPLLMSFVRWRNPDTGVDREMVVYGMHPGKNPFRIPEIAAQSMVCANPEGILFDEMSTSDFGPVPDRFRKGGAFYCEVNGRRVKVQGLFAMGQTLASSGHALTGIETLLRLSEIPQHHCNVGVIKLQPGADPRAAAARLTHLLPADVEVVTSSELAKREQQYWEKRTPVGFITLAGMLIAMVVGAVIVYQILYTDINDHMREYATLKAMGLPDMFFMGLVVQEAAILLAIGFIPGMTISAALFRVAVTSAGIPTRLTLVDTAIVVAMATIMCLSAGLLATRRLRSADPADIFS
jgi:putative ABC transport system permease protein